MKKTTAVIVARKGSERIPGKMFQVINGETMIMRKVRQCVNIPNIQVVVATDAEEIKDEVEKLGAIFFRQPDEFCQGNDPNGMIRNALSSFESEQVLWAHPTNPFIDTIHYADALLSLASVRNDGYDSLFSVNTLYGHFWNSCLSPINFGILEPKHKVAAALPPMYAQNGGIFIRPYKDMLNDASFIGGRAFMYPMDSLVGWDIDYSWQLEFAQEYAKKGNL